MTLAAVLFDLDGTLVDTLPVCYQAFRNAVASSGGPALCDGEIHALFGPSEDGMMQRVLPVGWQPAVARYCEEYERLLPLCPTVVPDAGVTAAGAAWAFGAREAQLKAAGADVIFTDAREFLVWLYCQTSDRTPDRRVSP